MKKTLIAAALAVAAAGASAHVRPTTHYHADDGTVVYGNTFRPEVKVTYETDRFGRRVKVTETTTCSDVRVNRRNNHIRCLEEETTTKRELDRVVTAPRPMPTIAPVVHRAVERDAAGRRWIITTTFTCDRSGYDRSGDAVCYSWSRDVDRELVRRAPRSNSFDLDGDGRTEGWERILFNSFRDALDN